MLALSDLSYIGKDMMNVADIYIWGTRSGL